METRGLKGIDINRYNYHGNFSLPDGRLDMDKVLVKFREFMKEQFSNKDRDFLERQGRLVFLSFLKPIINGNGWDFKEPQASEEKRMDVVITFNRYKYICELKRWYGPEAHQRGIAQLCDYLDRQNQQQGWLVIFDNRKEKTWQQERIKAGGKDIFAVWV